ncbi:hypothetical protein B4U80_13384 [Leptotrombidium deliense]|uniref:RING-type domain-containing protein n=1 Tax=Leptotrombidium deliense TaxID=299467 RepID=A0A443S770_9ACAR|nr:hypothetical protein B4U80_13384 [Leptotrombidium deliense]
MSTNVCELCNNLRVVGSPDSCSHTFCEECFLWRTTECGEFSCSECGVLSTKAIFEETNDILDLNFALFNQDQIWIASVSSVKHKHREQCPICYEKCTTIGVVSCGHAVCMRCAFNYGRSKSSDWTCPLCRCVSLTILHPWKGQTVLPRAVAVAADPVQAFMENISYYLPDLRMEIVNGRPVIVGFEDDVPQQPEPPVIVQIPAYNLETDEDDSDDDD